MSGRLREIVRRFLIEAGPAGKTKLAAIVGVHPITIERWINKGCPSEHNSYQLALACGCSKEEALALAGESSSKRNRRTA